ncbi:VTT domain-containing protein [Paenibacillus sp. F411]|nr:VTT domain-containing protein [Paenibacillus sp. F411]
MDMKNWWTPAAYVLALLVMYYYRQDLLGWLQGETSLGPVLLLSTLLAVFPILPYKAVIGVLGYAFGTIGGAAVAWFGTTAAAVLIYAAASLYTSMGERLLSRYPQLQTLTDLTRRNPFKVILLYRMLPVVPQMAVNIYAGAAGIPFWTYLAASALGKIPVLFLYAYLGSLFVEQPWTAAAVLALFLMIVLPAAWWLWRHKFKQ